MSIVYLAEDPRLARRVAIKVLSDELAEDESFRSRFIRESQLAAGLDHPNIVPVYEAGEIEGKLFIAMRYVRGTDLRTLVTGEGRLAADRIVRLLRPIASALDAAHRAGLVHRDVKPANILVALDQQEEHPYLADFGLTKHTSSKSGLTQTGTFMGDRRLRGARADPGRGGGRTHRRVLARMRLVSVPDGRGAVRQGDRRRHPVRAPPGSAAPGFGSSRGPAGRPRRGDRSWHGEGSGGSPSDVHRDDQRVRASGRSLASPTSSSRCAGSGTTSPRASTCSSSRRADSPCC